MCLSHCFIALRYQKQSRKSEADQPAQYQLFDTPEYSYRVFVADMKDAIAVLTSFCNQRAGAEYLIKEANNDSSLAAHPSARWAMSWRQQPLVRSALARNIPELGQAACAQLRDPRF